MSFCTGKRIFIRSMLVLMAGLLFFQLPEVYAQDQRFESIVVNFDVPRLINTDIFVRYDGQTVYLPVMEIFNLLDINVNHDGKTERVYGYLYTEQDLYEIDILNDRATISEQEFTLDGNDFLYDGHELYLKIDQMKKLFGLRMTFDFSKMAVFMALDKQFPAYQKLMRRKEREKLAARKKKSQQIHHLRFEREYLSGGILDWMVSSNPLGRYSNHYYNLNFGGMLMGGDLSISGNGSTREGFDTRQLRYKWHYFIGPNKYITQIECGRVNSGGVFSRSLKGMLATNRPQVRRKHFQTVNLNGNLGEGWEVELYIDNKLTDYTQTDHSGEYNFNIDIYYGASSITLKMYGPNGEIRIEEQDVKVPYSLIPRGELEYTVSLGKSDGQLENGWFTQGRCFYGITSQLTAGINTDIPLSVESKDSLIETSRPMFGIETVFQPLTNLTFNGLFVPRYAFQGGISFTKSALFNLSSRATWYQENEIRNPLEQDYNITFSFSSLLRPWNRPLSLRFNISKDEYPSSSHLGLYYGFSTSISRLYLNYIGRYKISRYKEAQREIKTASSQLIAGLRSSWLVQPQCRLDFDHNRNQVVRYGVYLTRRVFRMGQLSISYERNAMSRSNLFMVTLNIFTPVADLNTRSVITSRNLALAQSQRGSIRYNQETSSFRFSRRSGVGQSQAVLMPFIDHNFNGYHDDGEETISGLRARIEGAGSHLDSENKIYYYDRMQAYDEYIVDIDEYSLDNPLLKPVHDCYKVRLNPNMVTAIRVPIVTVSEISGSVKRQTDKTRAGIGGIKIQVINLTNGSIKEITSFQGGDFYYLGLIPGRYRARIQPEQLSTHGYRSQPESIDFEISPVEGGTVLDDLDFLLIPEKR